MEETSHPSHAQRTTALAVIGVLAACTISVMFQGRAPIGEDEGGEPAHRLATGIDPNTAPWQELAQLPGIGERLARRIVAYRHTHEERHPDREGRLLFQRPSDLMKISGIGPKTVARLRPFLRLTDERSGEVDRLRGNGYGDSGRPATNAKGP